MPSAPRIEPMRRPSGLPRAEEPVRGPAMTVMNVRFETVHVGRMSGRALGPEFVAYYQPNHAVSVQYRSLVAEIATQLPGAKPRAILIASAAAGAGATTVAINLGITLAKQDETRVTLVDANFERPDLAGKLGVGLTPGLRDVLARKTPLAWSLQETMQPNLFALPAGRMEAPSAAVPAPIIEQLRSRSEWIIVDAGAWTAGLLPMAEACDAVYLVHSDADTSASERINAILGACGRLRGCIVTMR